MDDAAQNSTTNTHNDSESADTTTQTVKVGIVRFMAQKNVQKYAVCTRVVPEILSKVENIVIIGF